MLRRRLSLVLAGLVAVAALPYAVTAQPDNKPEDKSAVERRSPLPDYFGKIGVSDEQREKLSRIQDDYGAKIDALQQQIKGLIKDRDARMEAELTPGQKLRLQELKEEARQRAAAKRPGSDAAADPATPAN